MQAPKKHAANCKWAHPTLEEPSPVWLAAEERPWTCKRDDPAKSLATTDVCEDCPRWAGRDEKP